jgi:hypothetical protein
MTIRLNGSTSGYVEIDAPASGGNTSIIFPNSSGTLAKTNGNTWTGTQNFTGSTFTGGGLDLITTQTFSAASSVSINNCFTSTYENYQALLTLTISVNTNLYVRFRAAGIDNTSNIYTYQDIAADNTSVGASRSTNTTGLFGYGDAQAIRSTFYRPAVAVETKYQSEIARGLTSLLWHSYVGFHNTATAYDGITIYPASGTMTGTVRIYGYRNA